MKQALFILTTIVSFCLGFIVGEWEQEKKQVYDYQSLVAHRDTIIDTITYRQPVPVDSVVLRYDYVRMPIVDVLGKTVYDTLRTTVTDTFKIMDSATVALPITQKHYKDTLYDAYVSGFHTNLDSIRIYSPTITVTKIKPRRWGVGVQGGYGYTPKGFLPYVGLGVSYTIF